MRRRRKPLTFAAVLPAGLSLAVVGVAGLLLLGLAIVQFSRTD